jgi:hypothetical protein
MKRTTLLLLFVTTVSFANAQEIYRTYESGKAVFSDEFNKWICDNTVPCHLTFMLNNGVLSVNDPKGSRYVLGDEFQSQTLKTTAMVGWYAIDEDGKSCAVKLSFYKEVPVRIRIDVIYGHSSYFFNAVYGNR